MTTQSEFTNEGTEPAVAEEAGEVVAVATDSDRAILALAPLVDGYLYLKARGCDHVAALQFIQLLTASPALVERVYRE